MKTLILNFSNKETFGKKKNYVKVYEENGTYFVIYKYTNMDEENINSFITKKHAMYDVHRKIMLLLS